MNEKRRLASLVLNIIEFVGVKLSIDDLIILISNCHPSDVFQVEASMSFIMNMENYIWDMGHFLVKLKAEKTTSKKLVELIEILYDRNVELSETGCVIVNSVGDTEDTDLLTFKRSLMLIVYQLINVSLTNKLAAYSSELVDSLLKILGSCDDPWMDSILCILITEFSDLGLNSCQFLQLYKHCYDNDKYSDIFYTLFSNENAINNSLILNNSKYHIGFEKLSITHAKHSFIISSWIKLTNSINFMNSTMSIGSFKVFSLKKNNDTSFIEYSIENGRIKVSTEKDQQLFISFHLEIGKIYNISFAHNCESKKKIRIDMYINGLLIESKVMDTVFANPNDHDKTIFSSSSHEYYTLSIHGPLQSDNIIMELSSFYLIETNDYLQWLLFIYLLGSTYSGSFTDSNLVTLLPITKQLELYILLNKNSNKFQNGLFPQIQFRAEDIVLVWNAASNLLNKNKLTYLYKSTSKFSTGSIANENLFMKKGIALMDSFDSIGGFINCLRLVNNSNSNESLIRNLNLLFNILSKDKIAETNFISNSGYDILAALLKSKSDYITIEVLDCVLEFVGYNAAEPIESIIKNKIAYKALVLNFDLWQCKDLNESKVIGKFLLFQFAVFVQDSKYHQFNMNQMSEIKIIKRILLSLKRDDFYEDILPAMSNILWIIVRYNHSPDVVKLLLLHVIYSINLLNNPNINTQRQSLGGESILEIIKNLVEEQPKILKALNFNFLLSVMKGTKAMKKIALNFIIKIVSSNYKMYSKFVLYGGFPMLTNLLKDDWNDTEIINEIFLASYKSKQIFENVPIDHLIISMSSSTLNAIQFPHFLALLNNLMKFAAFQLKNESHDDAVLSLTSYVNALTLLKQKTNFQLLYMKNEDFMGSLIFLTLVIKQTSEVELYWKYANFLTEILINPLYTNVKEEILNIIEKLYGSYQIEFNQVVIPLLFDKIKSFQSLLPLLVENTSKGVTVCKIFICYFQSYFDINADNSQYLSNFEVLTLIIKKLYQTSKTQTKLVSFLKVLIREFADSFISVLMFYINNVKLCDENRVNEGLTTCCQIFMSNPDLITQSLNNTTFILLFSTFYKILVINKKLESLSLNCIRVLLLEKNDLENILDDEKISKEKRKEYIEILKSTLTLSDDQLINNFNLNTDFADFVDKYYNRHFDIYSESSIFTSGSCKVEKYIENKFKFEKAKKLLAKEIEPFNKAICNMEAKSVNASTQDEIDDFYHNLNLYKSLTGNVPYPKLASHKLLYPTEGKDRKRNKIINVLSDKKYTNFDNGIYCKQTGLMKDNKVLRSSESDNNELNDYNIISKVNLDDNLEVGFDEDRNRRILRNLFVHDQIDVVYNVTQIIGLDAIESILVLGGAHIYIVEGYFISRNGDICCTYEAPDDQRDIVVKLLTGLSISNTDNVNTNKLEKFRVPKSKSWPVKNLVSVSKRKFLLRDVGFELFYNDGSSILLTCIDTNRRNDIFNKLKACITAKLEDPNFEEALKLASQQKIKSFRYQDKNNNGINREIGASGFNLVDSFLSNSSDISSSEITRKWINGEISNFQYLMLLNTIAGRTFNDLTQYPVFPFVLKDYTSKTIDLNDPNVYRDLSKPMGAQSSVREQQFRDRYDATKDMSEDTPPFHYGTHYSSAMIVTSYLIRMHPFTESYLKLQGGKFDHPDRLFYSIPKLWNSASKDNTTDVRELIPEFYYLPEFLTNSNKFQFGNLQDGNSVDDVELPPWADNDPIKFVSIMRDALESEYVSEHLPEWIDLIFGYKQQGIEAIRATNVFSYLSYPGSIDIEQIHDEHERAVVVSIIHNFGQTPLQILRKKHPKKEISNYATQMDIKGKFKTNFQNMIKKDQGNDSKLAFVKLVYNEKNGKWIGIPKYVDNFISKDHNMKVERRGLNGICINNIHCFEQFTVGGYITYLKILSKNRFVVGFNMGSLKIYEFSNDRFKYITNAQRSMVKMEYGNSHICSPRKKKGIFQSLHNNNNKGNWNSNSNEDNNILGSDGNGYILLEIGSLLYGHEEDIIKIEYFKHDRIIVTLDEKRKWLTIWHECNKFELEDGEIMKMNQLHVDSGEKIVDFQICEEECDVYCITDKDRLIVWRINNGKCGIVYESYESIVKNCKGIWMCENFNDLDYRYGKLFLVGYNDERNGEYRLKVYYLSREFIKIEELMELNLGDEVVNVGDAIRMVNLKKRGISIVIGTIDGILSIR